MDHGGESGTCWKQRRAHLASLAVREKPSEEDIRYPVPTILRLYVRSSSRHLRGSRSGQYSIVRQDWCPSTGRPTAHHRRASLPGHTAPDHRAIEHPTIRSLILPEEERRALEDRRALVWTTSSGPLRPFFPIPGSKHRAFVRNLPSPQFSDRLQPHSPEHLHDIAPADDRVCHYEHQCNAVTDPQEQGDRTMSLSDGSTVFGGMFLRVLR